MKVSLRWLQEFIDLPTEDPAELALILDMLGHEIEGYEVLEPGWSDVVVGRVEEISPHPDADKVRICQVELGAGPQQIICGAWNFAEGAYVAVARPGAILPGDFEIGQRTIRGVESNGMICSESELGLGEDHSGILVLDGEPELGVGFEELVELPDVVFELAITPNRPDAMSLVGLARDLAARFDTGFRVPPRPLHTVAGSAHVKVEIGDPVGCRRFTAREIRGVTVGKSPLWVRHRLRKAGVRAISNVVDVTNYVMLELGHPLHAFDADAIVDDRLVVKRASDGETLVTLDGEERALGPEDLIIYDGDGPTSMSGTMGGARSEVSDSTTSVLMEAASWDPPTIMYMSRRHGLRSEASTRFERGVDPNLTNEANARAAAMVIELAGGEILEGLVDEVARPIEPVRVELRSRDVEQLLGPGIDETEVIGILTRLGMAVEGSEPIIVSVPTFRPDVFRPADLVEEVARIHGYEKFGASLPTGPAGGLTPEQRRLRKLLSTLVGAGVTQAVTIPFVTEEGLTAFGHDDPARLLRVINPLRDEESVLRPSLLPGLLAAARHNVAYGARSVSLFETGRVFLAEPDRNDPRLPLQTDRIAVVLVGAVGPSVLGKAGHQADADVALALVRLVMTALGHDDHRITSEPVPGLHPSRSAAVTLNGEPIGNAGELSPRVASSFDLPGRVAVAELDLAPLLAPVASVIGESPSPFPNIDFDLSFLLPLDVPVGDLVRVTVEAGSGMVESARVFDVFRGRGVAESERAVAINYRLRSPDQTLTNEEVQPVRLAMIAAGEGLGARLRGA
jgi:phenylalanyl-tRNA synthetase beta chain